MKKIITQFIVLLLAGGLLFSANLYAQGKDKQTEVTLHDGGVLEVIQSGVSNFFGAMTDSNTINRLMLWVGSEKEGEDADPWEGFNRQVYKFNDTLDIVFKPVAQTYKSIVATPIQTGVSNFFRNLGDVNTAINQLLQLKLEKSALSVGRLVINTTIGLGGLLEVYDRPSAAEDFGQTLGYWGVESGPYLVLPLFGPSNVRDGLSIFANSVVYSESLEALIGDENNIGVTLLNAVRIRSALLPVTNLLARADDPYLSARSAYLQKRAYDVADGKISLNDDEF